MPRYELLLAHENKGFQELYRKHLKFGNLKGSYIFDFDQLPQSFPFVYKKVTGAGSSGVSLIKSKRDLKLIKRKDFSISIKRKLIKLVRKLSLNANEYSIYNYRHKGFNLAVTQEFVKGLLYDYKILVFGDKYYALKRNVRDGDFRASGSGNFEFNRCPDLVLNYSKEIFELLDTPFISLDVYINNNECGLIEFQAINFGPTTLTNSPGYYRKSDTSWEYIEEKSCLSSTFSYAILYFLNVK